MKWRASSALIFVIVLAPALLLGQKPAGQRPPNKQALPRYDLPHEDKSKGIVVDTKEFSCPITGGADAHLLVKMSDDKNVLVHLAPPRFLKEYGFTFAKGDQIDILGSNVKIGEEESVMARKVLRGDDIFTFRDESGKPLW